MATWEFVAADTRRLYIPEAGGWLYRVDTWNDNNEMGDPAVALIFVAAKAAAKADPDE